ncbi:MAG: hypothetical protein ACLGHN_08630 [Bacteriovoracia bacterium]
MSKVTTFFTFCFSFMFWTFMAVHYGHMKTPTEGRGIASTPETRPWYDASFKL